MGTEGTTRRRFDHWGRGWPWPAVIILAPAGVMAVTAWPHVWPNPLPAPWNVLGPMGVMAIPACVSIAGYFGFPVAIELTRSEVCIEYLFGPTTCVDRHCVKWVRGNGMLMGRMLDRSIRSKVVGNFAFTESFLQDSGALIAELGVDRRPPAS